MNKAPHLCADVDLECPFFSSPLPSSSRAQDPLHYPHGTKFMAPGPMGQCHPIPDDEAIREDMRRVGGVGR